MEDYIGCNTTEPEISKYQQLPFHHIFYVVSSGEIVVAEGAPIMVGHCPMIYIEGGGTVPFSFCTGGKPRRP